MEPTRHNSVASAAARGFTLVEMIVVVAIIGIITTIAVAGQGSFNRSMVLTETAYTVAFSIREAQALGVSSRIFGTIQNAGYGVHFATGRDTSYDLFADIVPVAAGNTQNATLCPGHSTGTGPEAKPGNCRLDNATEVVRTYSFNNGFRILKFCGRESGGTLRCSDLGGNTKPYCARHQLSASKYTINYCWHPKRNIHSAYRSYYLHRFPRRLISSLCVYY